VNKTDVVQEIVAYLTEELSAPERDPAEIQRLLTVYRFIPTRDYEAGEPIIPSSLVELDLAGTRAFYFIAPQGGGLITRVGGKPVQVITPQSPLGEALLGKRTGDTVEVEIRGGVRRYTVVASK
jgi:hypothetical protein